MSNQIATTKEELKQYASTDSKCNYFPRMELENEQLKTENAKLNQCLEELKKENDLRADIKTEETVTDGEDKEAQIDILQLQLENFSTRSSVIVNNPRPADPIIKTDELWFNQFESLKEQVWTLVLQQIQSYGHYEI